MGTCNTTTGVCTNPTKANGTGCNDGNACTQTDTCQGGSCTGSSPVVCTAQSQCHDVGTCNTTTGVCTNPTKANGTVCNDGNACTQSDTCQGGSCTGASPVVCTALSQCHNVGTCNVTTGVCTNPPKGSGASCNDANACTTGETCNGSGSCTGGTAVVCPPPSNQCRQMACNVAVGCQESNKPNGTACNDGTLCTQIDQCSGGSCAGTDPRVNANFDWADDPGGSGSGPDSMDVFSYGDGTLGTVGSYRGTLSFWDPAPQSLGLPVGCRDGLYLAAYRELGGVAFLQNVGCARDNGQTQGDFTVTHAAVHPDDSFTIVGSFIGRAEWGQPGDVYSLANTRSELFVARYRPDGKIAWVARAVPGGSATIDSVATLDDLTTVVVGSNDENMDVRDAADASWVTVEGPGVWSARFRDDGAGIFGSRVVHPVNSGVVTARAVFGNDGGRWVMTGGFDGQWKFGPGGELTQASQGAADVWVLSLKPSGSFEWAARIGSDGSDAPGDVTRLAGGAVMVVADTLGKTPSVSDPTQSVLLREITSALSATHVLRFELDGKVTRAALAANGNGSSRGWQVGTDALGRVTVVGTFGSPISLYGDVGFGAGPPSGAPFKTLTGVGPRTLWVARADEGCRLQWAVSARGDGSDMTVVAGWDVVQTDHPSLSISLGGMFRRTATFGDQVPEVLVPANASGSPFVVHLNSEAEYDYCP